MNKPKFVIGIGSQRAGSTLLHRILDECTDIFMHPVKELHYFDTLYNVRAQNILTTYSQNQLNREIKTLVSSNDHKYINNNIYKCFIRTNSILASKKIKNVDYFDLYRPCLMRNNIFGEITPEYMILPEEGIRYMSELLGEDTHIILITRDPVDRFISAFKLLKAYGNDNVDMSNFENEILDVFELMPSWIKQQKELNDYKKSLSLFSKYFNNILSVSYENLTNNPDYIHKKLEEFLSIDVDIENYYRILTKKVNQIGETKSLSMEAVSKLERLINNE